MHRETNSQKIGFFALWSHVEKKSEFKVVTQL